MYLQIYFHPVYRSMEVILDHLLKRAKYLYQHPNDYQPTFTPYMLMPLFNNRFTLDDYLSLDDGVLSTYFIHWTESESDILADLARRFLNRRPFKSAPYDNQTGAMLEKLTDLIATAGFNAEYSRPLTHRTSCPTIPTTRKAVNPNPRSN